MDFIEALENSNPLDKVSDVASDIGDLFTSSGGANEIINDMRGSNNNDQTMKLFGDIEFTDSGSNNQRDITSRDIQRDGQRYAQLKLGNNGEFESSQESRSRVPDEFNRGREQGERTPGLNQSDSANSEFQRYEQIKLGNNGEYDPRQESRSRVPDEFNRGRESVRDQGEIAQVQQGEEAPGLTQRDISRDPLLRQADRLLGLASNGRDMMGSFQRYANNPNMLDALRAVQNAKPEYSNVNLIDENGDGFLDDARALVNTNKGPREVDALKTPQDLQKERVQQQTDQAVKRGGEIVLDEIFRGSRKSETGQSTGGRIFERMGREGTNGVNRVLKDILRGR